MKQRVFLKFHQFRFLQFFMSKTTWFFGVEISLEFVFGKDIFGWVYWVQMPPQILFGRELFFWIWFVKISFHIFGQNVSFKCFLVVVVLPHQQSLLSEKNLQIIPAVESFHVTKNQMRNANSNSKHWVGFLIFLIVSFCCCCLPACDSNVDKKRVFC